MSDDTDTLQAALTHWRPVPPGQYTITRPLVASLSVPQAGAYLDWLGVEITAEPPPGVTFPFGIDISTTGELRHLRLAGFKLVGAGLFLHAADNAYIEKFVLRDIAVEDAPLDGIALLGNVFQGCLDNCSAQDCLGNGLSFTNLDHGAVVSAIRVLGGSYDQNGGYGIAALAGPLLDWSEAPYDIQVLGAYCRDNKLAGMLFNNGFRWLAGCGLENNWRSAASFDTGDAGVISNGAGRMTACVGSTNAMQRYLLRCFVPQDKTLVFEGCGVQSESDPPSLTPITPFINTGPGTVLVLP